MRALYHDLEDGMGPAADCIQVVAAGLAPAVAAQKQLLHSCSI